MSVPQASAMTDSLPPLPVRQLADLAEEADRREDWPARSWAELRQAGVLRWSIPREYGGDPLDAVSLVRCHEELASACLTTAFILSQREAAVRRLLAGPALLCERLLVPAARDAAFLTVGLSQLTTSRQHQRPSLTAEPTAVGGYWLDGEVPWVTGADQAAAVVIGAALADGAQVLLAVPTNLAGVSVGSPMPLAALCGSRTAAVRCRGVELGAEWVIAGPTPHVLGKIGGGGLDTSALALGLAGAAVGLLEREAATRPELADVATRFAAARAGARATLYAVAANPAEPTAALDLRVECTRLALRATQAALTSAKGTGFVAPHPAQRWARQALFFLVWSCPRPVAEGVLADLLPAAGPTRS